MILARAPSVVVLLQVLSDLTTRLAPRSLPVDTLLTPPLDAPSPVSQSHNSCAGTECYQQQR
jgi:hypothetical protein